MQDILFYIPEMTPALSHAAVQLAKAGVSVTTLPCSAVTHVLLGIPSKSMPLPATLPKDVVVFGGNIAGAPYQTIDLLQDEEYLAANAAITAHITVMLAMEKLPIILSGFKTLIIGWGRIAKCLAPLLQSMGGDITVASRSAAERAILNATGFHALDTASISAEAYRLIINTAPAPVLHEDQCSKDAVLIDLASKKGIIGDRVLWARGLPGTYAPESSGKLIVKTVLRYLGKEQL